MIDTQLLGDNYRYAKLLMTEELNQYEQVEALQKINIKNINGHELAAIAQLLLNQSELIAGLPDNAVDLVGTGGDGLDTFNISTIATFVAAAAGVNIAKHGNRASTSRCGSFDCLHELQIPIPENGQQAKKQSEDFGLCFLFAPYFHPQMKHYSAARKQLALQHKKTIFNLLGPLLNPAQVKYLAVGVYHEKLMHPMIEALKLLGAKRAVVFHGDGLDEATLTGPTQLLQLDHQGNITANNFSPTDISLQACELSDIKGGDAIFNAKLCKQLLAGEISGPKKDIVLLNAALAIQLSQTEHYSLHEALNAAKNAIDSGRAYDKLMAIKHRGGKDNDSR